MKVDAIDRAIKKVLSKKEQLDQRTWRDFEQAIIGKKLFLFGIGACTDFFWSRYEGELELEGIIDNDIKKQGNPVAIFQAGAVGTKDGELLIAQVEVLKKYEPTDVVILIGSSNYYKEIIEQLKEYDISSCFVLLMLEAKERQLRGRKKKVYDEIQLKRAYVGLCLDYPVVTKKIVINDTYGGHQRAIMKALLTLRNDLDIVFVTNNVDIKLPQGVRMVYLANWKNCIYELETSAVWIWDMCVPEYIVKRAGQICIQTKHWSSITLKKFALDDSQLVKNQELFDLYKYNSLLMDYIIVGSEFDKESCISGFNFHKDFIMAGSPRSDILFRESENRKKVYEHLNIDEKCHVVLYAPTFRYNLEKAEETIPEVKGIDLDYYILKEALEKRFGGVWKILLRLHPLVAKQSKNMSFPEFVLDVSTYDDSQELVSASDMLITDYSSIMFEAAFVTKKVFLFAIDRAEYIGKERDLLIDYDTLPFPIAESNEELARVIEQFDEQKYVEEVTSFLDSYGVHEDGHASERVAEFISDLIGK